MCIAWILSICTYTGVLTVCIGHDIMIVGDEITSIGSNRFDGWSNLVNVSFSPASELNTIADYAFRKCTNLQFINLPPQLSSLGTYCFDSCTSLESIHFPESLSSMGTFCFASCTSLSTLTFDENLQLKSLPDYAFRHCILTTFALWRNLETMTAIAVGQTTIKQFTNEYNNLRYHIDDFEVLFQGTLLVAMPPALVLDTYEIPNYVETIGTAAFRDSSMTSVTFATDSQLKAFGTNSFLTSQISSFTFPDSPHVNTIPSQMFYNCPNLHELEIPNQITFINGDAFRGTSLYRLIVADDHPTYKTKDGVLYDKNMTTLVLCPGALQTTVFYIPAFVHTIDAHAFMHSRISQIEFAVGSSLHTLGRGAFYVISQSSFAFDSNCPLTNIPGNCFAHSTKLMSITFPRALKTIDGTAFSSTGLISFTIPDGAEHLKSDTGVLYSFDMTVLYRFPPMKVDDYVVPNTVLIIGSSSFATCSGISSLQFEANSRLEVVQANAFASSSIESIIFSADSESVTFATGCFTGSQVHYVTLPGKMETIKVNLFKDCSNLLQIDLPESVSKIESGAFSGCISLRKLSIPQFCSITSIPNDAFTNTRSLKRLELPYLVRTINSLPEDLETIILWCPLTTSVVNSVSQLYSLKDAYILCGLELDTSSFKSQSVTVHQICFTKRKIIGRLLRSLAFCGSSLLHLT